MGLAAVTAAALTDHSAHFAMLTVAGVDLLLQPAAGAASGMRYGVDIESIIATERGPGGVSELTFTLDDPLSQVSLSRNMPVYFSKTAEVYPVFQGFLTSWTPEHANAGSGRRVKVQCTGLEAVLDWAILPAMTLPAAQNGHDLIQSLLASPINGLAFPIRSAVGSDDRGSLDKPIGIEGITSATALTITAGTTLREGIRAVQDDATAQVTIPYTYVSTVDSGGRFRAFPQFSAIPSDNVSPTDWTELFIENDSAAPINGDGLTLGTPIVAQAFTYEIDATTPSAVYVLGNAVSAVVQDQTGVVGRTAVISDSSLDTVTRCILAGISYLGQNSIQSRGSFSVDSRTPIATLRAGSSMVIVDTALGLPGTTQLLRITELERTFHGTLEDWRITYGGGGQPSFATSMRRLTRATLS